MMFGESSELGKKYIAALGGVTEMGLRDKRSTQDLL